MAQSDNFGFNEEAALLKESARKMLAEHFTADVLHKMVAGDPTPERGPEVQWDTGLWQQMVDLGWSMLAVPEASGVPMAMNNSKLTAILHLTLTNSKANSRFKSNQDVSAMGSN